MQDSELNRFERSLFSSSDLMRKGGDFLLRNFGKVIALLTAVVAALVTFTDIGFGGIGTAEFTAQLFLMLIASYVMFFSMEDAGEKLGEESELYLEQTEKFSSLREKIDEGMLGALRIFCTRYAEEEIAYRRRAFLLSHGLGEEMPENLPNAEKRIYRQAQRMRPLLLSPAILLSGSETAAETGFRDPKRSKLLRLLLRMLPSTLCTMFTVSVMLTSKDSLTAADIVSGILRLSALPVIAFKGYREGYRFVTESRRAYLDAKSRFLTAFLKERTAG